MAIDAQPVTFDDVPVDEWFACPISSVIEKGIFSGYQDARGKLTGRYGPADSITLGQLAKVAMKLANHYIKETVAGPEWATPYMKASEEMNLSTFQKRMNAHAPASRGAVIQTILEVLNIPLEEGDLPYSDVPAGSMYAKAIATATALGIVNGDAEADTFRPNAPVNRAEVAKMITLALMSVKSNSR